MNNFLNKIRSAFSSFMSGRYGADQLGYSMIFSALFITIIGAVSGLRILTLLADVVLVLAFVRMFSKNRYKRADENRVYLEKTGKMTQAVTEQINRIKNGKKYHYYTCPQCKERYRVPRGAGNITITCRKCGNKFDKKA